LQSEIEYKLQSKVTNSTMYRIIS